MINSVRFFCDFQFIIVSFKTDWDSNVWVLCDEYYDSSKINIGCINTASPTSSPAPSTSFLPSAVPSVSVLPSNLPSFLPSLNPTSTNAPTFYECSCEPGYFKFELELKTDYYSHQTSWEILDAIGTILFSDQYDPFSDQNEEFNYEYCLPVGCYNFVIYDDNRNGICCSNLPFYFDFNYDDEDFDDESYMELFDGNYKGSIYGRKEVFSGGEFGRQAKESFCGEDVCPLATRIPSLSPSVSSLPTPFRDCSCEPGEFKFGIQLKTDQYPWQTSWEVRNGSGDILFTNEIAYSESFEVYNHDYCLVVGCYNFMINDSARDGICCGYGEGYYEGFLYGIKEVFSGGEFGSNEIQSFCGEDVCPFATRIPSQNPTISSLPSSPPTLLPSQNPTSSSAPTFYDCSCEPGEFKFGIQLKTDQYPSETSWEVRNGSGDIMFTNEIAYTERFEVHNYDYCLVVGCYDFMINDSYGDGLCCGGYYEGLVYGIKEVFSGAGNFGFNEIQSFCGEDVCA